MTARRLIALKPWPAPLALSVAVHGALLAAALGLSGLVEPPRPERAIPVELVFAAAPTTAPASEAIAATTSSSFPRKRESSVDSGSPLSRGRRDRCEPPGGVCDDPAPTPPAPPVAAAETAQPAAVPLPPLPKRKPPPPLRASLTEAEKRAADRAIARMLDDAAVKAAPPPITNASASPPTPTLPHKGRGSPRRDLAKRSPGPSTRGGRGEGEMAPSQAATQQAARTDPAGARVPPGWGSPALGNAPPAYPMAARVRGAQGRVVLHVRVSADGNVERVTVATSSGHALLDEAARRAVAGWRFVPGRLAGVPVAASVDVPVTFRLED